MAEQIHKKFTDEQVKDLMQRYLSGELQRQHIRGVLSIGPTRFFALLKRYRKNPATFSVQYKHFGPTRAIDQKIEKKIGEKNKK